MDFIRLDRYQLKTSAKCHFVILSEAKDLLFTGAYEIIRSLCSLRMTDAATFAEVSVSAWPNSTWRTNPLAKFGAKVSWQARRLYVHTASAFPLAQY